MDITNIAQKLIDKLRAEQNKIDGVVEGVALLHDAIKREIESQKSGGEAENKKSANPPTASDS